MRNVYIVKITDSFRELTAREKLKFADMYNSTIIIPGSFSVSDKKLEAKAHEFYDNDSRKNCSDSECRTGRKIFWHVRRIIHEVRTGTRRKRHFIDTTEQE